MIQITKPYLLVYNNKTVIIIQKSEKLPYSLATIRGYFEADTKQEITDKISELSLTMTEDQKQEWSQIK